MDTAHSSIRLTSVEIACLWNSYMLDTMVHHMFSYFLQHVEDQDIKMYVDHCQKVSGENVHNYISFFQKENFPIPRGIISEDINLDAPRLYSDVFYINYIKSMAKFALTEFALFYCECSRDDIRKMFLSHLHRLEEVDRIGTEIMLSKGIYQRPPYIPTPQEVNFVKQKNLFNDGFFDRKRPLSVLEITQLVQNAKSNALGKALIMGFSQVAKSEDVRQILLKGKELSNKLYSMYSDVLIADDITAPPSFDSEVLAATESPFSDRFIMNHVSGLITYGINGIGAALSQSQRSDLAAMFTRVMGEVGNFANECSGLLIKNGWLEEPPLAPNRTELSKA